MSNKISINDHNIHIEHFTHYFIPKMLFVVISVTEL